MVSWTHDELVTIFGRSGMTYRCIDAPSAPTPRGRRFYPRLLVFGAAVLLDRIFVLRVFVCLTGTEAGGHLLSSHVSFSS